MLTKCVILWISYFVSVSRASVAPFIKPCTPLDSECIVKSAELALPYFSKGVEELGIAPIEPLSIKDVVADIRDLKLSFRKITIHQISQCKFISLVRDPVKSAGTMIVECPLIIKGDYTMGGKILTVDVEGDGGFEISGGIFRITIDFRLKDFKDKEDKKHYKITGFDYKFEPITKFDLKFENLYNGDKEKAKPIEQILRESSNELILSAGKNVMKEAMVHLVNIVNNFFHAVPLEDIEIA